MDQFFAKFEIKELQEDGTFNGYASTFGNVDRVNDIVVKGAFKNSLKNKNPREDIKFLLQHDRVKPLGFFTKIVEDDVGLYIEGKFLLDIDYANQAYILTKNKVLNTFSIGFKTISSHEGIKDEVYVRNLDEVDLFEISLVFVPANPQAKLIAIKSAEEDNKILVDVKNAFFNEKLERKNFENKLGVKDLSNLEVSGYLVYSLKNDDILLNFNAVESLPEDVKKDNEHLIRKFYMAFRSEYKDYSLFSCVCDKNFVINKWEMKDFDRLLKNNGFGSSEIKSFYNRLSELKSKVEIKSETNADYDLDII